ncbi:hypothetical protein OG21DRAFT_1605789 [Imleria badia]|nr:hypothetical protein OG21DRAFT_1605789 [Imleria badia]
MVNEAVNTPYGFVLEQLAKGDAAPALTSQSLQEGATAEDEEILKWASLAVYLGVSETGGVGALGAGALGKLPSGERPDDDCGVARSRAGCDSQLSGPGIRPSRTLLAWPLNSLTFSWLSESHSTVTRPLVVPLTTTFHLVTPQH